MATNINGKPINTAYGPAVIVEYVLEKEKFLVEYIGQGAIGWLTESQFSLKEGLESKEFNAWLR